MEAADRRTVSACPGEEFLRTMELNGLEEQAAIRAREQWDGVAKPLNGLGRLEQIVIQIAGITGKNAVSIDRRAVIAMCADNGVVAQGVTQSDSSVTAIVAANIANGLASVNRMAKVAGCDVLAVDIGMNTDVEAPKLIRNKIAYGTRDFSVEPAMSREQTIAAIMAGMEIVKNCREQGYQILATGEMGIGNTTTSSAMVCALTGLSPELSTGRGAGLSRDGLERKTAVIRSAVERYHLYQADPLDALCCVGGFDIAGLVGVYLGGAAERVPIVIDGLISAVAALTAVKIRPETKDFIIASHKSREPATEAVMNALGLSPVIDGGLALGEGTGAVLLFPMLDMALEVYRSNATFEEIAIKAYEKFE